MTDVLAVGLGGIAAAGLAHLVGPAWALVALGVVLPLVTLVLGRWLRVLEVSAVVPERRFASLRNLSIFAVLPVAVVETLALHSRAESFEPDAEITIQGEVGHTFYVIDRGGVEVIVDGVVVGRQQAGEFFGETALLRDVPRTATVRTTDPTGVLAIDRTESSPSDAPAGPQQPGEFA